MQKYGRFINFYYMEYKNIVGLVGPEILADLENGKQEIIDAVALCDILEIRYDWFEKKTWSEISARLRKVSAKRQLGTLRLAEDGGKLDNSKATERLADWKNILAASDVPEILDIEYNHIDQYQSLFTLAKAKNVDLLISTHDFQGIPDDEDMDSLVQIAEYLHADGIKIAAMSVEQGDTKPLYQFTKRNCKKFKYVAAFAMGETGQASRILTLQKGGNLTYGSFTKTTVPGQIPVTEMRKIFKKIPANASETLIFDLLGQDFSSNEEITTES